MAFRFKNIESETLGEYLIEIRSKLNFTLEEASVKSTVPIKYIKALENGDYSKLPASVYIVGFLRKLSGIYQTPPDVLIDQYKIEQQAITQFNSKKHQVDRKRISISITPKVISFGVAVTVVSLTVGWLVWQVIGINTSPRLEIEEPKEGAVLKESVVRAKGETDIGSQLSINKESVFVDKDGKFDVVLSISSGQKNLVFESVNKFNKKAVKVLSIVVDIPENSTPPLVFSTEQLIVEILVNKDLPVSFTVDGKVLPTETIKAKETKKILAKDKVILLTPDAGNTIVSINGKSLGPLGRVGETLTVPFTKDVIIQSKSN